MSIFEKQIQYVIKNAKHAISFNESFTSCQPLNLLLPVGYLLNVFFPLFILASQPFEC